MAWLENLFGESLSMGVKLAIIFVILLLVLLLVFWLFRKIFGSSSARIAKSRQPRLSITDAAVVDDKRRLVLVRRDNVEHLVMIGGPSDIVIEQNIVRAAPVLMPNQPPIAPTPTQTERQYASPPAAETPPVPSQNEGAFSRNSAKMGAAVATAGAGLAAAGGKVAESMENTGSTILTGAENAVSSTSDFAQSAVGTVSKKTENIFDSATDTVTTQSQPAPVIAEDRVETVIPHRPQVVAETSDNFIDELGSALGADKPVANVVNVTVDAPSKTEDEMERLLRELSDGR